MKLYFDDDGFDGQLQRSVGKCDAGMANVGECLYIASRITAGDCDSWYAQWSTFADGLVAQAAAADQGGHAMSAASLRLLTHFFSASTIECNNLKAAYAGMWTEETDNAWEIALPDTVLGTCPAATEPVYRLWNARADSNHRYTTSLRTRSAMIARGLGSGRIRRIGDRDVRGRAIAGCFRDLTWKAATTDGRFEDGRSRRPPAMSTILTIVTTDGSGAGRNRFAKRSVTALARILLDNATGRAACHGLAVRGLARRRKQGHESTKGNGMAVKVQISVTVDALPLLRAYYDLSIRDRSRFLRAMRQLAADRRRQGDGDEYAKFIALVHLAPPETLPR
jgi:hypothetical protein